MARGTQPVHGRTSIAPAFPLQMGHNRLPVSNDALKDLLERLQSKQGAPIPTSSLGRLRRTAAIGARAGLGALAGKLRGANLNMGSLSPDVLAKLVESFGELKGVAMKAGQILSYVDGSLAPEARELLAVLQVQSQATAFSEIARIIQEDLADRAQSVLDSLEREPVATASIGQVHRATRPDGTRVAVKIRHPDIEAAIRADFKTAAFGQFFARLVAPGANVVEVITEARDRFLEECDYVLEARRQTQFVELFAGHGSISIPKVHPDWCGPRVLTTTWHDGLGLESFLQREASIQARQLASRGLYEFYVGTLYRHGLFNADPHPGNLLFTPDGRATILDHGCVREFDRPTVVALVRLSRAVRRDDAQAIREALGDIGMPRPNVDFEVTRHLLRSFYGPLLVQGKHAIAPDRAAAVSETIKLKQKLLRMRLPGKLMFLFRIRFGLYAVLSRLGAELDWSALEDELTGE
jgi:predicted unusual protein kinase regulating ubiquinone biosynthesis (AarF/ABC1/UbiB family)